MRTLGTKEATGWLAANGIPEAPYSRRKDAAPFYDQVRLPTQRLRQAAVVRQFVSGCEPFGAALLQFTDWPLYNPDEMAVLCGLRALHGDSRPMIEAPGHLFDAAERDLLIGMYSLAMHYGYSAYLYFDHDATMFCWEGGILDFWCSDESRATVIRETFRTYGLPPVGSQSA